MFGRHKKCWKVDLNVEGELQARTVSRKEGLPDINPEFDAYPINVQLPKRTFKQAVRTALEYAQAGIYSVIYKNKRNTETN